MDRHFLKELFDKKFSSIHKNASKATRSFDEEAIHDLRVGYKKLRAFIRLLNTRENIKLPGNLKDLYSAAGTLRNRQIYFVAIANYCTKTQNGLPAYLHMLSGETHKAGHEFTKAVNDVPFDKTKEQLEEKLPAAFPDEAAIEFIEGKKHHVQTLLLSPHTDAGLHAIRKDLKDILYIFQAFKNEHFLEVPDSNEQALKKATDALGAYVDTCTNLEMLEAALLMDIPPNEKDALLQLQQIWTHEKLVQKAAVEVMLPGIV